MHDTIQFVSQFGKLVSMELLTIVGHSLGRRDLLQHGQKPLRWPSLLP